jgi:hypothetical protein
LEHYIGVADWDFNLPCNIIRQLMVQESRFIVKKHQSLVGGFKHLDDFPFHLWVVIQTPLTNSYNIFQDDSCTTKITKQ